MIGVGTGEQIDSWFSFEVQSGSVRMLSNRLVKSSNFKQAQYPELPNFWIWREIDCLSSQSRNARSARVKDAKIRYEKRNIQLSNQAKVCHEKTTTDNYLFSTKVISCLIFYYQTFYFSGCTEILELNWNSVNMLVEGNHRVISSTQPFVQFTLMEAPTGPNQVI